MAQLEAQLISTQRVGGSSPSKGVDIMVIVAQLAEQRIVIPRVAGSSPVIHPLL